MPIPESQLETWSHQGSINQSSHTYNMIKRVLKARTTPYTDKNFKVFLQGSYRNNTNIHAESDVDIVIWLDDCFEGDVNELSDTDKSAYKDAFKDATYCLKHFKPHVLSVLLEQYGSAVKSGDKAIAIAASGSRRKSDVIVAQQFRKYFKFRSVHDSDYVEGISFLNATGNQIVNYPKQHSANLTSKYQASGDWLKPMIRVFKNMRGEGVERGLIHAGIAPSYYIEGLLYNVPNEKFTTSYRDCVVNILNWYQQEAVKTDLVCANQQYVLLHDGYPHICWSQKNCDAFVKAMVDIWNDLVRRKKHGKTRRGRTPQLPDPEKRTGSLQGTASSLPERAGATPVSGWCAGMGPPRTFHTSAPSKAYQQAGRRTSTAHAGKLSHSISLWPGRMPSRSMGTTNGLVACELTGVMVSIDDAHLAHAWPYFSHIVKGFRRPNSKPPARLEDPRLQGL